MVRFPVIKPKDIVNQLTKLGFKVTRQTGSHARLIHPDGRTTTIAMHNRDLPKGTLRAILRQSKITIEEFLEK